MGQVTTRKVAEGEGSIILSVFLESDGDSGELENFVLLSPEDLFPVREANRPTFKIMQVWHNLVWFDVVLKFGGAVPRPVWILGRDSDSHSDFRSFGGLVDYDETPPPDYSGKLLISTNDFAAAGSQGSLVLQLGKTKAP